jgi:hypothetical protein
MIPGGKGAFAPLAEFFSTRVTLDTLAKVRVHARSVVTLLSGCVARLCREGECAFAPLAQMQTVLM